MLVQLIEQDVGKELAAQVADGQAEWAGIGQPLVLGHGGQCLAAAQLEVWRGS
jgi:hypothetical protein